MLKTRMLRLIDYLLDEAPRPLGPPAQWPGRGWTAWPLPDGRLLAHWAAGTYQGELAQLIRRAKFRQSWQACLQLRRAASRITPSGLLMDQPLLVPIPPDPVRLGQRGLHLPSLVAASAAHATGLRLDRRSLRAAGARAQQSRSSRSERLQIDASAYWVHPRLAGRRVVLVDDVLTTGMTLLAATTALEEQGAEVVGGILLARGAPARVHGTMSR